MTHRMGAKGQVVVPKELRERAGLVPGAEVEFEIEGERVTLFPRRGRADSLAGLIDDTDLAARLLEDRAREPR